MELTLTTNGPLEANGETSSAVMMSIAEIAARDGVSKPTVSIAVKRLIERHNLSVRRDRQGRVALVNVVQYDRMRGEHNDLSKAQSPAAAAARGGAIDQGQAAADPGRASSDPVYTREQARAMAYTAEMKRLDLEERLGRMVPVDRVRDDAVRVAAPMIAVLERLPNRSDEMVEAVHRGGSSAARVWMKRVVYDVRSEMADAIAAFVRELEAQPARPLSNFPSPIDPTAPGYVSDVRGHLMGGTSGAED